jgi:amidase
MQTISKDHIVRTFDATHPPAARVQAGEVFVMETNDRFKDWNAGGEWPMEQLTVMTGPVYVEGVQPGQVLAVEVLDIKASQGFGYVLAIPGFGLLKDGVEFRKKVVPIEGNRIRYSDTLSLPFVPNISKIGLAPAAGSQPSGACGAFGGQLSNSQLGPGSTVFLPVFAEGGLLTIEDVHAKMGDGEATASAVEIAATVTLRCHIAAELPLSQPLVITQDEVQTMGTDETAEAAARAALDELARLVVDRTDADMTEAAMLVSVAADLRISEMAGTPCHIRAAMKREILGL